MKKIFISLIGLFLLFNLSGCYNYQEIQRYAIITGLAIDKGKEEEKYVVTSEVLTFEVGNQGKLKAVLVEEEGNSIFEALRKMIRGFSKKMYGGHCKSVIISEEIAKEGMFEIFDYLIREHEFRSTISIFMAKGVSAKDILKETALYSEIAGYEIERLGFNDSDSLGYGREIHLYQAINTMLSEGTGLTIPILGLVETEKGKTFHLEGTGLFKNEKLIGSLEGEEVRFFLSFINEYSKGYAVIKLENGATVSFELLFGKTKTKVHSEKNRFRFEVNFKISFYIQSISHDKNDKPVNLSEKQAEELLAKYWKTNMMEVFKKIQEMNTDVLNYGRLIMGKDFKLWKNIKDKEGILQQIDVQINVKTNYLGEGRRK